MGYNNNYAGMHMIRYSRYGQYDDLKYYDKLAEQEKQCKKVNARPENSNSEDRKNKFKKKLVDLNNKYGGGYGVDELIDAHHFVYSNIVMSNVMIIVMKNKKDIYEILTECENTMNKDYRTNAVPKISWSYIPIMDKFMIFTSLLAEKLNCNIWDFFVNEPTQRKDFVYRLIKQLQAGLYLYPDDGEINMDQSADFFYSNFDHTYGMSSVIHQPLYCDMALTFSKEIYEDEINYSVSFGDMTINSNTKFDYMCKGAYLWEEDSGELKDYIEKIISQHSEWRE